GDKDSVLQQIKFQEDLLRAGTEAAGISLFLQDCNLQYIWSLTKHSELKKIRFKEKQDSDIFNKKDALKLKKIKEQALESQEISRSEITLRVSNKTLHFELIIEPIFDETNEVIAAMSILRDINSFIIMKKDLIDSNNLYSSLVENQADIICRWLPDLTLSFANREMRRFFSDNTGNIVGVRLDTFFVPEEQEGFRQEVKELIANPCKLVKMHRFNDAKGNSRYLQWVSLPVYDQSGKVTEFQSVGRDITELVNSQEKIEAQNIELQAQSTRLNEVNTALKIVLQHNEQTTSNLEKNVQNQLSVIIKPIISRLLKTELSYIQKQYVKSLETNLEKLTEKNFNSLEEKLACLTQREIDISMLIREGKTTKEISELLHLSDQTVKTHRKNIRRKLKCENKNLQIHLKLLTK
ncbi:MAG: PAS domain-containing protein, partial [Candidatus Cloacimonetes bacterium]|nr:PAS domain-containing protein [Candidatus Cloacimonadota bacterium]